MRKKIHIVFTRILLKENLAFSKALGDVEFNTSVELFVFVC